MQQILLRSFSLLILLTTTTVAQQTSAFTFRDLRLGMPISEFHAKHPGGGNSVSDLSSASLLRHLTQANCMQGTSGPGVAVDERRGVVRCDYKVPLENVASHNHGGAYSISTIFMNGKLAVIEIAPLTNTSICFERPPAPGSADFQMFAGTCGQFRELLQDMTNSVAKAGPVQNVANNRYQLLLLRWDNGSSIAELESEMCGPWNGADSGWANAISEALAGSFCGTSDLVSSSQPIMLYIDKELGRELAQLLNK
jgi:hypothetical protein